MILLSNLLTSQQVYISFVLCMIFFFGFLLEVFTRTHVWYLPLCQNMHVCLWTYQLVTRSLRVIGILIWGLESNHYTHTTMEKLTSKIKMGCLTLRRQATAAAATAYSTTSDTHYVYWWQMFTHYYQGFILVHLMYYY